MASGQSGPLHGNSHPCCVFDCFMLIIMNDGCLLSSTAISSYVICEMLGWIKLCFGRYHNLSCLQETIKVEGHCCPQHYNVPLCPSSLPVLMYPCLVACLLPFHPSNYQFQLRHRSNFWISHIMQYLCMCLTAAK